MLPGRIPQKIRREIQDKTIESLQINTEFVKQDLISKQIIKFSFQIKKNSFGECHQLKI